MKLKVGDKVRYINNIHDYSGAFSIGDELTIIKIINLNPDMYMCIKDNPDIYEGFDKEELGLINEQIS